jgi:hypothetical protein
MIIDLKTNKSEHTLTYGAKKILITAKTGNSNVENESRKISSAQILLEVKSLPHNKLSKHIG